MGDITDAKDNHPASLVNRIVSSIRALQCDDIKILAGNHDWLLRGEEFFRFLNHLPGVEFITSMREDPTVAYGEQSLFLPYTKTPAADWKDIDFAHYDYVYMHQTIKGARASNGQVMDGEALPQMPVRRKVYSGDIHVPQDIGGVTYIGSPYHVHFGDNFEPRVLLLERGGKETWLRMPSPRRVVVKVGSVAELENKDLVAGDQVKLRLALDATDKHAWSRIKREAVAVLEDRGVLVHGVELVVDKAGHLETKGAQARSMLSPPELLRRFVEHEELGSDAYDAGMDVLES